MGDVEGGTRLPVCRVHHPEELGSLWSSLSLHADTHKQLIRIRRGRRRGQKSQSGESRHPPRLKHLPSLILHSYSPAGVLPSPPPPCWAFGLHSGRLNARRHVEKPHAGPAHEDQTAPPPDSSAQQCDVKRLRDTPQ